MAIVFDYDEIRKNVREVWLPIKAPENNQMFNWDQYLNCWDKDSPEKWIEFSEKIGCYKSIARCEGKVICYWNVSYICLKERKCIGTPP